ncbi:hypothetical protein PSE_1500 [Pseudovibrio sp. FO-BEG1]|nr:hypothetical protein PSE_1500 [Pseudovibrio sp. FO-BEG1]
MAVRLCGHLFAHRHLVKRRDLRKLESPATTVTVGGLPVLQGASGRLS